MQKSESLIKITGKVLYIKYHNEDNGYTVFCVEKDAYEAVNVVGYCYGIQQGDYIAVYGRWIKDEKYGDQLRMDHYEPKAPTNLNRLAEYIGNGMFEGIGKELALRIVKKFGQDTMDILENHPERMSEISGIGKKRAASIAASMKENLDDKRMMMYMSNAGIPPVKADKIKKIYGQGLYNVLQQNPYQLIGIDNIGFKTADKIAKACGVPANSKYRVRSGIQYALKIAFDKGHICYPKELLISEALGILGMDIDDQDLVVTNLFALKEAKEIDLIPREGDGELIDMVYDHNNYQKEKEIAERLAKLAERNFHYKIQIKDDTLDETQLNAVKAALENGLMVLTGGPGCGKTTTLKKIIECFERCHLSTALAAPTGRAAKRMEESTGRFASTIHRLINMYQSDDEDISYDAIIIDESSMLDMPLLYNLLDTIDDTTRLVLVGDKNQLPSVGPGSILKDIIDSGICPVHELTKVYRQAAESDIIANSNHILKNEPLEFHNKDFFFINADSQKDVLNKVLYFATNHTSKSFLTYMKAKEAQVLTPFHGHELGTDALNEALRKRLNPQGSLFMGFRVGDKVLQTRNNYELIRTFKNGNKSEGVMNGDVGRIKRKIEDKEKRSHLIIEFEDGSTVDYNASDCEDLTLAYAMTVHKSQGSEYPVVIIPVFDYYVPLTTRNLIYTAITRAKKGVLLIGRWDKLMSMVANTFVTKRYTGLTVELREAAQYINAA